LKIKSDVKDLKKAVMAVSRAVDQKPSTPSLQGIYIKCVDGSCEIIGSDLDLIIKASANVEIEVEGECLINARILTEVLRKLPSGSVTVSDIGSEIKIETDRSEYNLRKLDHLTYPQSLLEPNYNEENSQKIFTDELFSSLKKVGIASSPEGGKPILTGVCFDNNDNKTNLVSTDSYRLAVNTVFDLPITDAGIVSFRSLNEVIKLFEENEGEIYINSSERELHFYNSVFYASVRKLEGSFPAYENLFPKENLFSIEVPKTKILEALDRSTVVAEGFIPVTLKISKFVKSPTSKPKIFMSTSSEPPPISLFVDEMFSVFSFKIFKVTGINPSATTVDLSRASKIFVFGTSIEKRFSFGKRFS